ncbi:FkbM family methyltransferase [Geomonas oryzae]|uniref:FkbM family methyltransferase n=1 Tax=Geomonas oryzae TaxID=2364273 RepID=UPI00100A28CC|nr:FkbM family methyltransferase [Geomonas oryzae]
MLLKDLFKLAIPPGATVFDIGAFEGELSLFFAALAGKEGRVYSFEPHPEHFLALSMRACEEPCANVFPYCRAISATAGHQVLFLAPDATAQSSSILPELGSESRLGAGVRRCLVETDTVDDFSRSIGRVPDFIKIDTEGAERLVLEGARRVIESSFPTLVFEGVFGFNAERGAFPFGEAVPSHVAWLESIGYRICVVDIDYLISAWVSEGSRLYATNYGLLSLTSAEFSQLPLTGCNLVAFHGSRSNVYEQLDAAVSDRLLDLMTRVGVPLGASSGLG